MASLDEQNERMKIALRLWARQGKILVNIGGPKAEDERKQKLNQLAAIVKQADELIETL